MGLQLPKRVRAEVTVTRVGRTPIRSAQRATLPGRIAFARAECTVTVRLTLWQWIRQYLLFGWVIKH